MENKKIDINISEEEISDEIKDEMKEADEIRFLFFLPVITGHLQLV